MSNSLPFVNTLSVTYKSHVSLLASLKILFNTAQIIWSIDSQIGMVEPWPSPFEELVQLYGVTNLSFMQIVPAACMVRLIPK